MRLLHAQNTRGPSHKPFRPSDKDRLCALVCDAGIWAPVYSTVFFTFASTLLSSAFPSNRHMSEKEGAPVIEWEHWGVENTACIQGHSEHLTWGNIWNMNGSRVLLLRRLEENELQGENSTERDEEGELWADEGGITSTESNCWKLEVLDFGKDRVKRQEIMERDGDSAAMWPSLQEKTQSSHSPVSSQPSLSSSSTFSDSVDLEPSFSISIPKTPLHVGPALDPFTAQRFAIWDFQSNMNCIQTKMLRPTLKAEWFETDIDSERIVLTKYTRKGEIVHCSAEVLMF